MHEYDYHIGDYTRDTVGLSMEEDGAYHRLMDQYYAREMPLPVDKREVYRMARAATPGNKRAVDYILDRYFVLRDDGWHQNRIDREIAELHAKSETARTSANRRWELERERQQRLNPDANAMRTHSEGNAKAMRTACETDAARARRLPPSGLPPSALPSSVNRDSGVHQPSTPEATGPDPPKVNGAHGKTVERRSKARTEGAGQQWGNPRYVNATAQTLGIPRRPNEDDDAFKDRVYTEVQRRRTNAPDTRGKHGTTQ